MIKKNEEQDDFVRSLRVTSRSRTRSLVFSGVEARGPVRTLPGADFVRLGEAEEHL